MTSAASISVVVIAWNEIGVIRPSLEHLLSVTAGDPAVEIICADGDSSDGTAEVAAEYVRVVSGPGTRAAGLNAGASTATGEILLFLHADTRLPGGALRLVRDALADRSVVGGRFRVSFDNPSLAFRIIAASINFRDWLWRGFTGDQAIFVRRGVFERMRGFAEVPLMEDLDFARRVQGQGRVALIRTPVVTAARRWERHGTIRTIVRMWTLRAFYRLGSDPRRLAPYYDDVR